MMREPTDPLDPEVMEMLARGVVTREQVEDAVERRTGAAMIGRLAVERGMLEPRQVMEILRIQRSRGFRFGELCVRKGWLRAEQVSTLLDLQRRRAGPLADYLVQAGAVTADQVAQFRRR